MKRTGIFAFVVIVGMLSGCTPASPDPTSAPTPSTTPVPSATPEPEPGARVSLTCDQIVPPADRVTVIGAPGTNPEESSRSLAAEIAPETAGVRVCEWQDLDTLRELRVTVTADPADLASFGPVASQSAPSADAGAGTIGDRSFLVCGSDFGSVSCSYSVLSGPYWFGGYVHTALSTVAEAEAAVTTMSDSIVDRLASAPPAPLWSPPQHATVDPYDCSWMDGGGTVGAAIGVDNPDGAGGPSGPPTDTMAGMYAERVGAQWCLLSGYEDFLSVEYVAGSGWAWESAMAGWAPVDVGGAGAAAGRCVPDRERFDCAVRALVGDTIVQANSSGATESESLGLTIAGLSAAIPLLPLAPS